MTSKSIFSAITCAVLFTCFMVSSLPATIYAANTTESRNLVTSAATMSATTKKTAPKLKTVKSVKAVFKNGKTSIDWSTDSKNPSKYITMSWKAPKKVKALKSQTYTVRYWQDVRTLINPKTKKASKTSIKLPLQKAGYVQIRVNAQYGKEAVHSKWVSYRITTGGGGGSTISNGVSKNHTTSFFDLSSLDGGKPGSYESSLLARAPRSLKLSNTQLTSSGEGSIDVSWKAPKTKVRVDAYCVRYSYKKSMKNA